MEDIIIRKKYKKKDKCLRGHLVSKFGRDKTGWCKECKRIGQRIENLSPEAREKKRERSLVSTMTLDQLEKLRIRQRKYKSKPDFKIKQREYDNSPKRYVSRRKRLLKIQKEKYFSELEGLEKQRKELEFVIKQG